jgi:cadmium resistance protein CadD (predicted permease)
MLTVLGAASAAFALTNIDGFILLTALFAVRPRRGGPIVVGQYLGLATLVAASVAAALGLLVIPQRWIGLLGVVPLVLGIRALLVVSPHADAPARITVRTVATLMVANGADNLAVYVVLFRRAGAVGTAFTVAVFAVLAALWCIAAALLGTHTVVVRAAERSATRLIPIVFIAIGSLLLLSTIPR